MLISLWNYLRGYVMIEVSGFSVERFMNMAVHKGIFIWDVVDAGDTIRMKVSVKAFKMLKSCARKTSCHVKIAAKKGYPFVAHRYRKRKFLVAGAFVFVLAMYALSMFVWLIDVQGTNRLGKEEIIEFCGVENLRIGALKLRVDTKALEKRLLNRFSDIAWVNVHIKGTKASISLKETIPRQVIVDRKTPCDIVAAKDGLIVSVATSAGTPLVKQNDVVHQGDMLVKGELVVKNDETGVIKEYVHADALVLGKLYYDINFDIPFEYTEKQFTQNSKRQYSLKMFDTLLALPFGSVPYESFQKSIAEKKLGFGADYPLPVALVTTTYKEFVPVQKTRTLEQIQELAERMITARIIREFDFSADVIEKKIEFVENKDYILVKSIITTIENVGVEKIIEFSGQE